MSGSIGEIALPGHHDMGHLDKTMPRVGCSQVIRSDEDERSSRAVAMRFALPRRFAFVPDRRDGLPDIRTRR